MSRNKKPINYVRVFSSSDYSVKRNAPKSTSDRIHEIRKELGLNLREESVLSNIRASFRALSNPTLNQFA